MTNQPISPAAVPTVLVDSAALGRVISRHEMLPLRRTILLLSLASIAFGFFCYPSTFGEFALIGYFGILGSGLAAVAFLIAGVLPWDFVEVRQDGVVLRLRVTDQRRRDSEA